MIELGYMAKRISERPRWLEVAVVDDVYAVANCVSEDFCDYVTHWRHNGFWLFDSPAIIREIAAESGLDLTDTALIYCRGHAKQYDSENKVWTGYDQDNAFPTNIETPLDETLAGFDVVTFSMQNSPECSPLSCNGVAANVNVNKHCLIDSLDYAIDSLENGVFDDAEPGPYRIIEVNMVPW